MIPSIPSDPAGPMAAECRTMELMSSAADAISFGDLIESMIYGYVNRGMIVCADLLSLLGTLKTPRILPDADPFGRILCDAVDIRPRRDVISFAVSQVCLGGGCCCLLLHVVIFLSGDSPAPWLPVNGSTNSILGKTSTINKARRVLKELQLHLRLAISADKAEVRETYIPWLLPRLVEPLLAHGSV